MSKLYLKESLRRLLRHPILTHHYISKIEKLYAMHADELEAYNESKFLEIFNFAISNSTFYKKLYSEYGIKKSDIQSIDDINKLPILDKNIIKNNVQDILTTKSKFLTIQTHTSGSTGNPLELYRNYKSVLKEEAYLRVYRKRVGLGYNDKVVSLRGHLDRKNKYLQLNLFNILYLSSYQISESDVHLYHQLINNFKPKAIEGYPSSLYNLCLLLDKSKLELNIPLCFTSSETLFEYQRSFIQKTLHTEVFDFYGLSERSIALGECLDHKGYMSFPGYSYNEFKQDAIITTSFINKIFPLIRYKVDDVVELSNCVEQSSHRALITKIIGRVEDTILAKDGTYIGRLNFLFDDLKHIENAQIHQYEKGIIQINLVGNDSFGNADLEKLEDNIDKRIGLNNIDYSVHIISKEDLVYSSANKFKLVINHNI